MSRLVRPLLALVGVVAVGLGIAGIFLPLVPTTPFLLLAAACFLRSSERLHRWLLGHPILGGHVRAYQDGRGVPARAKALTLALLWTTIPASGWMLHARLGPSPAWWTCAAILAASAIGTTWYMLVRLPTRHADEPLAGLVAEDEGR